MPDVQPIKPTVAPPAPAPIIPMFDAANRNIGMVTAADIASDPKRWQALGSQSVRMVAPDGKKYDVPASTALEAQQNGGYSFLGGDDAHAHAMHEWQRDEHGRGAGMAVADAMSSATFGGIGDIIDRKFNPEAAEIREETAAENPTANKIGTGLGIVGNLALGGAAGLGGIGAAVEGSVAGEGAGLALRTAGRIAGGAVEGAAYTAPEITAHLAVGDAQAAAESLGTSMAVGGLLHGALGLAGDGWRNFRGVSSADKAGLVAHGVVDEAGNINLDRYKQIKAGLDTSKLGVAQAGIDALGENGAAKISSLAADNGLESLSLKEIRGLKSSLSDEVKEATEKLQASIKNKPIDGLVPGSLASDVEKTISEAHPGLMAPPGGKIGPGEYDLFMKAAPARNEAMRISHEINSLGSESVSLQKMQTVVSELEKSGAKLKDPTAQAVNSLAVEKLSNQLEQARSAAFAAGDLKSDYARYLQNQQHLGTIDTLLKTDGSFLPAVSDKPELGLGGNIAQRLARRVTRTVVGAPLKQGIGALTGGALGSLGGAPGFVIGSIAGGYVASKVAGALGRQTLEHAAASKALGLSTGILGKIADNPATSDWLGSALAKQAAGGVEKSIQQWGSIAGVKAADTAMQGKQRLDFDQARAALNSKMADTQAAQQHIDQLSHVFGHDPDLQSQIAGQQLKTLQYLHGSLPPEKPAQPFQKEPAPVSRQDKKAFMDRLEVAQNPNSLLGHVRDNTLTPAHVDAMKNLYPQQFSRIQQQIEAAAHDPNGKTPGYATRQTLSLLTGNAAYSNPNGVNYQAAAGYGPVSGGAGGSESAFGPAGKGGKAPKQPHMKLDKMPDLTTGTQKRSGKL